MPNTKFYTENEEIEVIEEIIKQLLLIKEEEKNEKNIINRVFVLNFLFDLHIQEIENEEKIKNYNYKIYNKLVKLYEINDPKKREIFNKKNEKIKISYISEVENEIKNNIKNKEKNEKIAKNKKDFNENSKKFNEKFKNNDLIAL